MQTTMKHQFSQVPQAEIPRSSFDRSHGYKTTFDAGLLIPIFCDEALPGDTFNLNMTAFARLATPLHPIMDNMHMDTFYFAVPYRLIWDNWEKFNGAQDNPADTTDYLLPEMTAPGGGYANSELSDYFGIPTNVPNLTHTSVFHRAYNLCYNEWFRDENLQDSIVVDKGDGPDTQSNYVLQSRGKRHDYFTSALPWPQKGPSVPLPLGDKAPITGLGIPQSPAWFGSKGVREADGTSPTYASGATTIDQELIYEENPGLPGYPNFFANLAEATAATINELRQSFQIQKLYERDARGGTRYTEIVKAHFGVTSPDARLQRPEYLGGGSTPINVTPVPQTSASNATDTPQGNLAAIGVVTLNNHGFTKSFTEHCILIGLVSVRADLTYQQGLNRSFSRRGRFDFYWPALSHIGEQSILNKEIFAQGSNDLTADAATFGFQERYAEYRYKPSQITGNFRSNYATTLDTWHLAQDFSTLPLLNDNFIVEKPPIDRIIAVQDEPQFLFDSYSQLHCARPMPVNSVPGLIDHF